MQNAPVVAGVLASSQENTNLYNVLPSIVFGNSASCSARRYSQNIPTVHKLTKYFTKEANDLALYKWLMKLFNFLLLFMSMLSFNAPPALTPAKNTVLDTLENIAYGKNPAQRMDVYLPANRSSKHTRSLILLHGGGWSSGSRHSFTRYVDSLKNRMPDYAIFNVDYRLVSDDVHFTDQEVDIKAAIDFIAAHAHEYGINTGKIVLLGVSAGGHLALLQAYKNSSPKIAAVIDFFGPTDLITMYNKPWSHIIPGLLQTLIGGTPQTNPDAYRDASPVSFVNASTPPTLIFQGRQDPVVNISQSQLLQQSLDSCGVKNNLVIYDREGHGWYGSVLSDSFDKIEMFLKQDVED